MANYVILDTETAPTVGHKDNKAETSLVYDFGYTIRDCNGCELVGRSFIIAETFTNVRMMNSAYYAEKLPQYHAGMGGTDDSEWRVVSFMEAWQTFKADCKLYDVKTAWAYNARFDLTALNNTICTYSNGYVRFSSPTRCSCAIFGTTQATLPLLASMLAGASSMGTLLLAETP